MSSEIVIDTNIYSAYSDGVDSVREIISSATKIYIPIIVLGELHHGFFYGSKTQYNLSILKEFLASSRASVLHFSDQTPVVYGEIITELKKSGKPMQTNDIWIAALCKELNLPLVTKDKGFENILGLTVIN